ncbi:hypothetical protein QVD17_15451 [Tagetes erecta]|uniref:Uncharacterized protein n=1 Tax=Tagetes erecta TaxID=13708 RepID=A0AAD8KTD2_TARER|nr:hypothetical protein QVD17_15451 [Tagetes erecta]
MGLSLGLVGNESFSPFQGYASSVSFLSFHSFTSSFQATIDNYKMKKDEMIQSLKSKTLQELNFVEEVVLVIGDEDFVFTHIISKLYSEGSRKMGVRLVTPTPNDGRWPDCKEASDVAAYGVNDLDKYLEILKAGTFHKEVMIKPLPSSKTNKTQE